MPAVAIISGTSYTGLALARQLETQFPGQLSTEYCAMQDKPAALPEADLVVFSSREIWLTSRHLHATLDPNKVLIGSRTLDPAGLEQLAALPIGSRILLVNDSATSCSELHKLILEAGMEDIDWIEWYPGCTCDISGFGLAITAGEKQLVPPDIPRTIDIGSRLLDSYTLTLVSERLWPDRYPRPDFEILHSKRLLAHTRSLYARQQERDEYASQLNDTRNYLRGVLEALPTLILAVDTRGIIHHCNQAAVDKLGGSKQRLLGNDLVQLLPAIQPFLDQANTAARYEAVRQLYPRQHLPPFCAWADLALFSLRSARGLGFVIRIEDVTRQVEQEIQLQRLHKHELVGQLAASIVHDYNNYLNAITGSLSMLELLVQESSPDRGKIQDYADNINQAAGRISHFNKQLLHLSKDSPMECQRFDLRSLCRDSLNLCKAGFPEAVESGLHYADEELPVSGDFVQLEEVLVNLMVNAAFSLAHTPRREDPVALRMDIHAWQLPANDRENPLGLDACCVSVCDNGTGIPPEVLPRIFEPFFSTKNKNEGSGLGLAIVWQIIERHKGRITVRSKPGEGACFVIFLPRAA